MSNWLKWRILKDEETGIWAVFEKVLLMQPDGSCLTQYCEFPSGAEAIAAFAAGGR